MSPSAHAFEVVEGVVESSDPGAPAREPGARRPAEAEDQATEAGPESPQRRERREHVERERRARGPGIGLVGFAIATWGAMCGIGGGLFAVPTLHYVYRFDLKQSVVTSLSLVAATTISATLTESLRADSRIDWALVACLVVGSLLGAQLGFRVAQRIETRLLKAIFSVLLLFVGIRILGWLPESLAASGPQDPAPELGTPEYVLGLVIGLGGGFVAPMLGIGGGLVAVPALLFAIPGLGHLGARACSMAMGTVTSTRSMLLYFRAGQLDLRRSATFAFGAAAGAFLGVQIVHVPGVAEVAKKMLAVTLLLVAARFAVDVLRGGKADVRE